MGEAVLLERVESGVCRLTMNRPERRNALTRSLIESLTNAFARLEGESAVRVIVVTGAGAAFCAGMDLDEVQAHANPEDAREDARALTRLLLRMQRQRQPIIAALNGHAVAGGAGVMTACDLVVASEDAKIGYPEVQRGLIAAIVAPFLVRQVGDRRARRLLLTGELIGAREAERIGLITEATPRADLEARCDALARQLRTAGPDAVMGTKRRLAETQLDDRAADIAAEASAAARLGPEAREGLAAFLEKRHPAWWPKE